MIEHSTAQRRARTTGIEQLRTRKPGLAHSRTTFLDILATERLRAFLDEKSPELADGHE